MWLDEALCYKTEVAGSDPDAVNSLLWNLLSM
jgi:hypothetical protein